MRAVGERFFFLFGTTSGRFYEGQHYRYMRGGSKDTYAYNLRVWVRNNAVPDYFSPGVGFRCARQ